MLNNHSRQLVGTPAGIQQFILAGKAEFILVSRRTGDHFAYRVRRIAKAPDRYYVNAGRSWDCIGWVHTNPIHFEPRRNLREAKEYIEPFAWFMHHLADSQVEIWHVGKCAMCSRPLTDPISIARGIGPECAMKLATKQAVKELFA